MISVIAFDYGGVIEVSEINLFNEIVKFLNIDTGKWLETFSSLKHLCNSGNNTFDEVILLSAKKLNASDDQLIYIESLINKDKTSKVINREIIDLIKELKKGFKIALLSNYSKELRLRLSDQGLLDLFDEVIISGEVGYKKPQSEIFNLLCERTNINMSELIFIDDSKSMLEGAKEIGYTPILFIDNEKLREDLSMIIK